MGVNIEQELRVIANASSGSAVKDAIYMALLKIADAGSEPGGGSVIGNTKSITNGMKFIIAGYAEYETEGD
jgi:hypothetical protein